MELKKCIVVQFPTGNAKLDRNELGQYVPANDDGYSEKVVAGYAAYLGFEMPVDHIMAYANESYDDWVSIDCVGNSMSTHNLKVIQQYDEWPC